MLVNPPSVDTLIQTRYRMRSLTPIQLRTASLASQCGDTGHVAAVAADPESTISYVALEKILDEGGVSIRIIRLDIPDADPFTAEVCIDMSVSSSNVQVLASFESPVLAPYAIPSECDGR